MPTTMPTFKFLSTPIGFPLFGVNMQAIVACLTCILGRNCNQLNSKLQSFVSQENSQLVESPRISSTTFCFVPRFGIRTFSNSFKVFNRNPKPKFFRLIDNAIADGVIEPRLKPSFLARQPFQEFSGSAPSTPRAQHSAFFWMFCLRRV